MPGHILIIEDEATLAKLLTYNLEKEGYSVEVAGHGGVGLQVAMSGAFDLIILDIMLPGMNGFEILEKLRAQGHKVPVIMLTARTAEEEIIQGLVAGADDYITKPFSVAELFARVAAVLRRTGTGIGEGVPVMETVEQDHLADQSRVVTFGDLRIYPEKYEAWIGNEEVSLRPKEFEMLLYFVEHPGIVLTRDQLMNAIWGYDYMGGGRTVDVHLSSLRKKLAASSNIHFDALRGIGYKLVIKEG